MSDSTQGAAYAEAILAKLDELIAAMRRPVIVWGDARDVGALLGRTPRFVLEKLAPIPDFPQPFPGAQPRWLMSEVEEWALETRRKANKVHKGKR